MLQTPPCDEAEKTAIDRIVPACYATPVWRIVPIFILLLLCLPTAHAEDPSLWDTPRENYAAPETMAFTSAHYRSAMSDSAYTMAVFDDGRVLMFSLFHYVSKLFEKWGAYLLLTQPGGPTRWATADIPKTSVHFADDRLRISDGVNSLSGVDMRYRLKWRVGDLEVDLTYENIVEPWILGDGRDILGDPEKAFQIRSVFSPWARVTGTVSIDGVSESVRGEGMGEKTIIVNRLSRFNPELLSMRVFGVSDFDGLERPLTAGYHIGLLDSTAHPAYGSKRIPRLFVTYRDDWLFTTGAYELEYVEYAEPAGMSYEYPVRFTVEAQAAGYSLSGEYRAEELFDITDIVSELPLWLRKLVLIFLDRPVYMRSLGVFEGTLRRPDGTETTLFLYGPYEYVVVR